MKTHPRRALLGLLALVGAAACSDLPTAPLVAIEAGVVPTFDFAPAAVAVDPIVNGGFETGDFTGWTFAGPGDPSWQVSEAGAGGAGGLQPTAPPQGTFAAWNVFTGMGPTSFTLYQDVALPGNNVALSWQYRAQWVSDYPDNGRRTVEVQLRDPGTDAVLATLDAFATPAGDGSGDTGWLSMTAPFTGTTGQMVRIHVTAFVPDFFPGAGQLEVDNFAMVSLDPPAPEDPPSEDPPEDDAPGADPTSKDQCMKDGWEAFGFKNQGQCVRFVETEEDSR